MESPRWGATVVVVNEDTNISAHLTTNETGYYEAALLIAGYYRVTAELPGFKQTVRSRIRLLTSARVQVDLTLSPGDISESITVSDTPPLLDTLSGLSGRTMDNKTQSGIPTSLGQVQTLARFATGVQAVGVQSVNDSSSQGGSSGYIGNNTRMSGNLYTLDGALTSGIVTINGYLPHTDTVAEMKLEIGGFDATIGQTTGLMLSMVTKSGTNQFHGSASNIHNQNRWNGTPFFTRQLYYTDIAKAEAAGDRAGADELRAKEKQSTGRRNTFVATVGGPVIIPKLVDGRNRLFFFFSYSGDRWNASQQPWAINHTFPTMKNREGDFTDLLKVNPTLYQLYDPLSVRLDPARPGHYVRDPIPGNILPKSRIINPMYEHYVKFLPVPNNDPQDPSREPVNNYLGTRIPLRSRYNGISNRFDYQPADKHRLFGRWVMDDYFLDTLDWAYETEPGLQSTGGIRRNLGAVFDWIYTPNPSTVLDGSVSFHRYDSVTFSGLGVRKFKPSDVGLPKYIDEIAGGETMLPVVNARGYMTMGMQQEWMTFAQTRMAKFDVSHVRSGHSLQAGMNVRISDRNAGTNGYPSGYFEFSPAYTKREDDWLTPSGGLGHSWASFMMGVGYWGISKLETYALQTPYYAGYVQDSWRVSRRFNLNVGLRWEYEPGPVERYDRALTYFDYNAALPIAAAAEAAYAANPIPDVPASQFKVRGGPVYAGYNGAPRNLVKGELMWLPRVSAAYSLDSKTVLRGGYGTFMDSINALGLAPNQHNFSRATGTILSTDYGMNWLIGDPSKGIAPQADPFPVRADGTRIDMPIGNQLGTAALLGSAWTNPEYNTPHVRARRWRFGVQRQFGANTMLEVAYAGSYADRILRNKALNFLPEQYFADGLVRNDAPQTELNRNITNPFYLPNFAFLKNENPMLYQDLSTKALFITPTIRKYQLIHAYPHMSAVNPNLPIGEGRTDALEVTFERRFSQGFNFFIGYTRLRNRNADYWYNPWDEELSWRTNNDARPHRFVATNVTELPFGKGKPLLRSGGPLDLLVGGWQLGMTYEYQPGPILGFGNYFYYGDLDDITTGEQTFDRWFNTDNFERVAAKGPAAFHKRVFPIQLDNLRAQSFSSLSGSLSKEFAVKESVRVQVRCDSLNVLNRSTMQGPSTDPYSTNFGRITAATSAKRWIQLQGKVIF